MNPDRCPVCGAATAPAAVWCSLCFADLRTPVTVPAEAVTTPSAPPAPVSSEPVPQPVTASLPTPESGPEVPRPRGATWACHLCGEPRGVDEDECPTCGAGLLPTDAAPSLNLPGLGDVRGDGQRTIVMVAGAFVVTVVLVLVMFIAGALLK